ncbi:tellurium resistance protein [Streptomyces sp. NPDC093982]|uniref:vWA domain-containing protein n=1 Tax=Streptomyces sp. NPDC093982 TaxID=3155077 RepID=UPI003431CE56
MTGHRAAQLNFAIREAVPEMREVAEIHPTAGLEIRAVMFGAGAQWHMEEPVNIDSVIWRDVSADDNDDEACDMGAAFRLAARALHVPPMPRQAPPPVLALVSGTQPTDDWRSGLRELAATPWGSQAVRIAIPVGADADHGVLQEFLSNSELRPLDSFAPRHIAAAIRWAETVANPWPTDDVDVW